MTMVMMIGMTLMSNAKYLHGVSLELRSGWLTIKGNVQTGGKRVELGSCNFGKGRTEKAKYI